MSFAIVTSEKHAVQHREKLRKNLSLNYKSGALSAGCDARPSKQCADDTFDFGSIFKTQDIATNRLAAGGPLPGPVTPSA